MARERPNHVLHFLLLLITAGFWLPVWLFITLAAGNPHTGRQYSGMLSFLKWWLAVIVILLPLAIGMVVYEAKLKRDSLEASSQKIQTRRQ